VIVWNDDVNTFEHVIRAMVEILGHTVDRAEQLTIKVHQEGRSIVAVRRRRRPRWRCTSSWSAASRPRSSRRERGGVRGFVCPEGVGRPGMLTQAQTGAVDRGGRP